MARFHRETKKKNRFEGSKERYKQTFRQSQRQKIVDSYARRGVNRRTASLQHLSRLDAMSRNVKKVTSVNLNEVTWVECRSRVALLAINEDLAAGEGEG